jgi:uncharacterized membrane protein YeaQ/YmgE (transglycosylase-associated protein family)
MIPTELSGKLLPVFDLHYSRILEWLTLTGIIPGGKSQPQSQSYIDIDIQFAKSHLREMKNLPDEISAILIKDINYFEAQKIMRYLEQIDGAIQNTVFGIIGSEAVKSWWKLLRSWENDNLHVKHASNQLIHMMNNDLENTKRKLFSAEKTLRTLDNR